MFGFLRPCRHHLGPELHARWAAHLCGLCLTLRDGAGQVARTTTHVDALVVSVLAEAQGVSGERRAGPCPLRGMRPAPVVVGPGARLAASTALLLAADRVDDHVTDRDGVFSSRPAALLGARVASRWSRAGTATASAVGFDPVDLLAVPARPREVEARAGVTLAEVTAPTEAAVGAALAHTAALAHRPGNAAPLDESGRLLGRLAHLLDAIEDRADDEAAGRWNPLTATGTSTPVALARCQEAAVGIGAALRRVGFGDVAERDDPAALARRLACRLLVHETGRAVDRVAARGERPGEPPLAPWDPSRPVGDPADDPDDADPDEEPGDEGPRRDPEDDTPARPHGPRRDLIPGCAAAAGLCCTGQLCCADEFTGPWSGRPRENCAPQCCDCSEVSCDCCSCGDDGCCSCCSCCGDRGV